MVSGFIVFGTIAGGIYFNEFSSIGFRLGSSAAAFIVGWICYVGGMLLILTGLYLIASAGSAVEREQEATQADEKGLDAAASAKRRWRKVAMVMHLGVHSCTCPTAAHLPTHSHPGVYVFSLTGLSQSCCGSAKPPVANESMPLTSK